ncbi:hypothetical protein PHET_10275 [Paragonimus heterotremus]|uniref:Uncharacterized protein n=1 Tax=Paragonimus heterotremus TaxID=100268 RepID=A0A8J4T036_9TREM|nr:hypothetical protein PHET_10275 [Paragonimus heterotremus]
MIDWTSEIVPEEGFQCCVTWGIRVQSIVYPLVRWLTEYRIEMQFQPFRYNSLLAFRRLFEVHKTKLDSPHFPAASIIGTKHHTSVSCIGRLRRVCG